MMLVAEATNGQEALELFERHKPDVTLMDLQMPVSRVALVYRPRGNHIAEEYG